MGYEKIRTMAKVFGRGKQQMIMPTRFIMPVSLIAALAMAFAPALVSAAPKLNHGLTINAVPKPIISGEGVLIYGQLKGPDASDEKIVLHERINPAGKFTIAQRTLTNASGFYEFTRSDGVILTNRSWFASSPGPGHVHSRTVHELVAAVLSFQASSESGETNHPLTFTGQIAPAGGHAGEPVLLQEQAGETGDGWRTIGRGVVEASSDYSITHDFRRPGAFDLRTVFAGDVRNTRSQSDLLTVVINQAERPAFTINTSTPTIVLGSPVTISGVLYEPGSSTIPLPAKNGSLWGHEPGGAYAPLASTVTGADGSYSFTQTPSLHNEVYQVQTTSMERMTAQAFVGVADTVTISPSSTTSAVGKTETFTGTLTPDDAGHTIYLERLGSDANFHIVSTGVVTASSVYMLETTLGTPGTKTFRVRVPGGEVNASGLSPTVTVTVTLPGLSSLPPAS
jgi:hypothetical protein